MAELAASRLEVIWRLAKAAELRDEQTGNHVIRVGCYSRAVAAAMGLSPQRVEGIFLAAPLHDIGKIGVPDALLLKTGILTGDERRRMQQHCEIGAAILADRCKFLDLARRLIGSPVNIHSASARTSAQGNPVLHMASAIALCHHEKWDGSGYPRRLAGEAIPLEARIVAIADVYDALRSDRSYKRALPRDEAMHILRRGSGSHFDPAVHAAFVKAQDEVTSIERDLLDAATTTAPKADYEQHAHSLC
jgi:putative two-component system response regulator